MNPSTASGHLPFNMRDFSLTNNICNSLCFCVLQTVTIARLRRLHADNETVPRTVSRLRCVLFESFCADKKIKASGRIPLFFGAEGETRTLAPVARPTPLAGAPRHQLEYFCKLTGFTCQDLVLHNLCVLYFTIT